MMVIAGIVGSWEQLNNKGLGMPAKAICMLFVGVALSLTIIAMKSSTYGVFGKWTLVRHPLRDIALTSIALGAVGSLLIDIINRHIRTIRLAAVLCTEIMLVMVALFYWDQRTPWRKFIELAERPPVSLTSLLPREHPIFWENEVTVPWFLLKRSSYFSCAQGTGALFNRGTAINYQRRYESFQTLQVLDSERNCPATNGHAIGPLSRAELSSVCKREPGLAALVLT